MTVTINGTTGITTPGVNSTGSNVLGDNVADTLNVGNGAIVTDSSGNVGIGTSSPASTLHVKAQAGQGVPLKIEATDAGGNPQAVFAGSRTYQIGTGNSSSGFAGSLFFYDGTAGAERMRIDSSGNLLVGTTTAGIPAPSGFNMVYVGGSTYCTVGHVNGTAPGQPWMVFSYNGGAIGSIVQNGTTSTNYNTTSDYRLKENIQPIQNALATVAQLNPVTYTWKADGSDGQGFIAHELQAVVPDCVTGEKDAVDAEGNPVYQGIDTSFLVATLTKAIQEQQAQIETLTTKVAALEAK